MTVNSLDTRVKPDVWAMPSEGIEWCDCGDSHEISRGDILEFSEYYAQDKDWITHEEVVQSCMSFWNYDAVCEFFLMKVRDSAIVVAGEVKDKYPMEEGIEIIGYFSKTWQGCPEEACESTFEL